MWRKGSTCGAQRGRCQRGKTPPTGKQAAATGPYWRQTEQVWTGATGEKGRGRVGDEGSKRDDGSAVGKECGGANDVAAAAEGGGAACARSEGCGGSAAEP